MDVKYHTQPGWFDLSEGTCFIWPRLPYPDETKSYNDNQHAFIIISSTATTVQCMMSQTLYHVEPDGTIKDKRWLVDPNNNNAPEWVYELRWPHPPMDERPPENKRNAENDPKYRRQYVDPRGIIEIAKEDLWNATNVRICCDGGDTKLDMRDVQALVDMSATWTETYITDFDENRKLMTDDEYKASRRRRVPDTPSHNISGDREPDFQ